MKNKNEIKFKFISPTFEYPTKWLDMEFKRVVNPLPYQNLPDGEYLIRGNKKEHRTEYWKYHNIWYLVHESKKDNGHYVTDCTRYMLFPILSDREWDTIRKVGWKRLTKLWRRYLSGYIHWKELTKLEFETKLSMRKFDKNKLYE